MTDQLSKERDKIRQDLQKSDERASSLAIEIDEQTEAQDKRMKAEFTRLNMEWAHKLRDLQQSAESELQQNHQKVLKLEKLVQEKNEETKSFKETIFNDFNHLAEVSKVIYSIIVYRASHNNFRTMEDFKILSNN